MASTANLTTAAALSPLDLSSVPRVAVAVIGSGPAALALVLRVLRTGLNDLWTEDEHQRRRGRTHVDEEQFARAEQRTDDSATSGHSDNKRKGNKKSAEMKGAADKANADTQCSDSVANTSDGLPPAAKKVGMVVIDPQEHWCGAWNRNFEMLRIKQLRSIVLAHPCPSDPHALRSFAAAQGRSDEVVSLSSASELAQLSHKGRNKNAKKKERRKQKNSAAVEAQEQVNENNDAEDDDEGGSTPTDLDSGSTPSSPATISSCSSCSLPASVHRQVSQVTQSVHVWPIAAAFDLAVPSSDLFRDFVASRVQEQNLENLRVRAAVMRIERVEVPVAAVVAAAVGEERKKEKMYLLTLSTGARILASSVVASIGNAQPRRPAWTSPSAVGTSFPPNTLLHSSELTARAHVAEKEASLAAAAAARKVTPALQAAPAAAKGSKAKAKAARLLAPAVAAPSFVSSPSAPGAGSPSQQGPRGVVRMLPTLPPNRVGGGRLLIVGGGLTSAQLALAVLSSPRPLGGSVWTVDWCARGWVRTKAFDVDLEWVSASTAAGRMFGFFAQRDHSARLQTIRAARQGGSVTPEAWKELQKFGGAVSAKHAKQELMEQRLNIFQQCEVTEAKWVASSESNPAAGGHWAVKRSHANDNSCSGGGGGVRVDVLGQYDAIWFATGSCPDVVQIPCLASLQAREGLQIHEASGLPILNSELEWKLPVPTNATTTTSSSAAATTEVPRPQEPVAAADVTSAGTHPCCSALPVLEVEPCSEGCNMDDSTADAATHKATPCALIEPPCAAAAEVQPTIAAEKKGPVAESSATAIPTVAAASHTHASCDTGSRFHVIGGLACLQLGPDAFNLMGARAASRILFQRVRGYLAEATNEDARTPADDHHETTSELEEPPQQQQDDASPASSTSGSDSESQVGEEVGCSVSVKTLPTCPPAPAFVPSLSARSRSSGASRNAKKSKARECFTCGLEPLGPGALRTRCKDIATNPFEMLQREDDEEEE